MDYQLPSRSPVIVVICTLNLRVVALRLILQGWASSGFWLLGSGFWLLGSGFWVLGSGFWVLGSGFWVLGSGFWVLGSGFWVLGSGFWVLGLCGLWGATSKLSSSLPTRMHSSGQKTELENLTGSTLDVFRSARWPQTTDD
jgi:hypothetical protein